MKNLLRGLLCFFALGIVASSGWAQTQAGVIKAMKVTGSVTRVLADGTRQPVADGMLLTESDTIETGGDSGLVLVFMNGSSVKLGAKSRLAIEEFKMDPLASDIAVGQLKAEPSVSKTGLNLSYGELVGDVKKLNKSSTYRIKTPVGAAGIRGTTFRIVFVPAPDGRTFNFTLSTSEGTVVFQGTTETTPVEVSSGTEVVVQAEVNTSTGQVASTDVQTRAISQEAAREIQSAVAEVIQQAQDAAVFTPAEQNSGSSTSDAGGADRSTPASTTDEAAGADAEPSTEAPAETPTPQITTPQPIDTSSISRSN